MKNLILFFVSAAVLGAAENWPQFRGPGALGLSSHPGLPEQWSATENVRWETLIPGARLVFAGGVGRSGVHHHCDHRGPAMGGPEGLVLWG